MSLYTKHGDCGETSLASGERVSKCSARLEAYGELDELNSALGLAIVSLPPTMDVDRLLLFEVQKNIFTASSWLATLPGSAITLRLPRLFPEDVGFLETAIDRLEQATGPLRKFILPGGSEQAARLHMARTICRRAERRVVAANLPNDDEQFSLICAYINRLSDYLFALARYANHVQNEPDIEV